MSRLTTLSRPLLLVIAAGSLAALSGCILVVGNRTSPAYGYSSYDGWAADVGVVDPAKYIGVGLVGVSEPVAAQTGAPANESLMIETISTGSPADLAGLKRFDVIVAVDGQPFTPRYRLTDTIRTRAVGETIRLTIARGGERFDVDVPVAPRP